MPPRERTAAREAAVELRDELARVEVVAAVASPPAPATCPRRARARRVLTARCATQLDLLKLDIPFPAARGAQLSRCCSRSEEIPPTAMTLRLPRMVRRLLRCRGRRQDRPLAKPVRSDVVWPRPIGQGMTQPEGAAPGPRRRWRSGASSSSSGAPGELLRRADNHRRPACRRRLDLPRRAGDGPWSGATSPTGLTATAVGTIATSDPGRRQNRRGDRKAARQPEGERRAQCWLDCRSNQLTCRFT